MLAAIVALVALVALGAGAERAQPATLRARTPDYAPVPGRFVPLYRVGVYVGNPERWLDLRLDTRANVSVLSSDMLGCSQSMRAADSGKGTEIFYLGGDIVELDVVYADASAPVLALAPGAAVWQVWDHESVVALGTFDRALLDDPSVHAPVLRCLANTNTLCTVAGVLNAPDRGIHAVAVRVELQPAETNMHVPRALYDALFAGLNVHTTPRRAMPTLDLVLDGLAVDDCIAAYHALLLAPGAPRPAACETVCARSLALRLRPADYIHSHGALVHSAIVPHDDPDATHVILGAVMLRSALYIDLDHGVAVMQRAYEHVRYTVFNTVVLVPLVVLLVQWGVTADVSLSSSTALHTRIILVGELAGHVLALTVIAVNGAMLRLARRIDYFSALGGATSAGVVLALFSVVALMLVFHTWAAVASVRGRAETEAPHSLVRAASYETSMLAAIWVCCLESPRDLLNMFVTVVAAVLLVRATVHAVRALRLFGLGGTASRLWRTFGVVYAFVYAATVVFVYAVSFAPAFSAILEHLADRHHLALLTHVAVLAAGVYAART